MTVVFTSTTRRAHRGTPIRIQPNGHLSMTHGLRPMDMAMSSVAAVLADVRAPKPSRRTIDVLRHSVCLGSGSVEVSDIRSTLTDTWSALVALHESESPDEEAMARQRLVVVLAEMLCSPLQMPHSHRQSYWELLQHHLRILNRSIDPTFVLQRIDRRFPRWMDSLNRVVRYGKIQPVTYPSKLLSASKRLSAEEELNTGHPSSSGSLSAPNEAQYFGNSSDHWRRHTSHR